MTERRAGLVWFVLASYRFIKPAGLREHLRFARNLPGAYATFRALEREKFNWKEST